MQAHIMLLLTYTLRLRTMHIILAAYIVHEAHDERKQQYRVACNAVKYIHSAVYKRINQREQQPQKFAKEAAYIVREVVSRCVYLFAGAVHCYSFRLVYYYNIAIVYSCQVHIFKWIMRLYVGNMENINSYCKVVHSGVYCNCAEGKALEYNRKE